MEKPSLLILAAGIGSRYGGLKQVDGMGPDGEAILEYSVFDAIRAGFGKVVFVIRKDIEEAFREKVGRKVEQHVAVEYAFQEFDTGLDWLAEKPHREKPWGTGHAVLAAKNVLNEPFATINADDFYGEDAFRQLGRFLSSECTPQRYGMVAYRLNNTLSDNGAVSRGVCNVTADGKLADITERTKIQRFPEGIAYIENDAKQILEENTPVSMNLWGFHHSVLEVADELFRSFVKENMDKPRAEFYIPSVVSHQLQTGKIQLDVLDCTSKWYGVTYPEDKETVQAALKQFRDEGEYPGPLWSRG